jgi:hypothetical protein
MGDKPGLAGRLVFVNRAGSSCSPSIRFRIRDVGVMTPRVFGTQRQRKQSHEDEGVAQGE